MPDPAPRETGRSRRPARAWLAAAWGSDIVKAILLALAYYAVARASLGLSFASSNASPVWPPSGIALAALLLGGPRLAPGVFIGAFAANLVGFMGNGAAAWPAGVASACIAAGNLAEAGLAAWASRRFIRGRLSDAPQGAYVFAAAALGAAVVSASCGVVTLVLSGIVPAAIGGTVWLTWWLGDVTGLLVIAPLLLHLREWRPRWPTWQQGAAALVLFALAGGLAFGGLFQAGHVDRLMAYGLVTFIAWAALRHGSLGAATATFGIAALSIAATLQGRGPFAKATVNDSLVSLDGFLALCAISGMVLAASLKPRPGTAGPAEGSASTGRRLPAAILLAGLATTLTAWHFTALDTERRAAERFAALTEEIQVRIRERMNVYEQALRGGRGLFDASTSVEREEWQQYVQSLTVSENYPGIQGLGYSLHVPAAQRSRHVERVRAEGLTDYDIRPAGERAEYTGVVYLEPQDTRNRRAIGYDMFSEPVRRAAMERARDSGQPSISGKVTLLQETDKNVQAGFLMYVPVYQRAMPTTTARQRQAALAGYVYGPFRMDDLMAGILRRVDLSSVSLLIFDGDQPDPAALMYANGKGPSAEYPHQFAKTASLSIAGHPWRVAMKSTQAFEAAVDTQKAQIALVAGTLISLLLFSVVRALAVMREEALALAQQMSAGRAEAEQRFESLAESSSDAILVLDALGRVQFSNLAGSRLFGRTADELAGIELHHLLAMPGGFETWVGNSLSGAAAFQVLDTIGDRHGGASTPVEVSLGAWSAHDVQYYSVTARDVSARRQVERELQQAMQQARQASLAKSQFLANMSHEIRTPMNAVMGLTYLLGKTRLDLEQSAFLSRIGRASKSLLAVINDVLDLSKIEAGELTIERAPFDLPGLVAGLAEVMDPQAQAKAITFEAVAPPNLPVAVTGDATRLSQVLSNLVSNAIKFTDRGSVTLRISEAPGAPGRIGLRFAVEDTGIGIEPDAQPRLFAPFAQADASTTRRFGGTGLGLSIVKHLTEHMGGEVGFTSQPGKGSVFWIKLDFEPAAADSVVRYEPNVDNGREGTLAGVRVLAVDDSDINLDVVRRILELEGARVTLADNGWQAVELLRASPQAFDAVLMDVQMPTFDGYEATESIRRDLGLHELPIIALTAGALTSEHQRATEAGMDDFITKPFDPRQLVACIERHVPSARAPLATDGPVAGPPLRPVPPWPEVEGIDANDARTRLGGDVALFGSMLRRLLGEFIDDRPPPAEADPAAWLAWQRRMHKLRGCAGQVGAKGIAALAAEVEHACGAGDRSLALRLAPRLAAELARTKSSAAAAGALEPVRAEPTAAAAATGGLDPDAVAGLVRVLRQRKLDALDRFDAVSGLLRQRLGAESHHAMREDIENLRFDEAAAVLEALTV